MNKTKKFIDSVEFDLLSALFRYVVPFIDKRIKTSKKQEQKLDSKLESIVNDKPKIAINDIKELESLIFNNLNGNIKVRRNSSVSSNNIFYSLSLKRQKREDGKSNKYSISIKYEENQSEEKLKLTIINDGTEIYSVETANKKEAQDKVAPYKVAIFYEDNYSEERLAITYKQQIRHYLHKHIEDKEDMTNRVPLKWLNILPENIMGGVLGFTYLGENFMGRRADLVGKTARMVDIHESIHTPDEYETRVLTSWIMSTKMPKYKK